MSWTRRSPDGMRGGRRAAGCGGDAGGVSRHGGGMRAYDGACERRAQGSGRDGVRGAAPRVGVGGAEDGHGAGGRWWWWCRWWARRAGGAVGRPVDRLPSTLPAPARGLPPNPASAPWRSPCGMILPPRMLQKLSSCNVTTNFFTTSFSSYYCDCAPHLQCSFACCTLLLRVRCARVHQVRRQHFLLSSALALPKDDNHKSCLLFPTESTMKKLVFSSASRRADVYLPVTFV